jgi:diguanylate cyclase (GGDEF)-like protein
MTASTSPGDGVDEELSRREHQAEQVAAEQTIADLDQTASDTDETNSESDQTSSEQDQSASDHDSAQAASDQRTSDRDQIAADRERATHPDPKSHVVYDAARADRVAATLERVETARARAQTADDRSESALERDETAHLRDLGAEARDRAAAKRDALAARLDRDGLPLSSAEAARQHAAEVRARAATERARSATDRENAAADRAAAARDRQQAEEELKQALLDPLTGAYGRKLGMIALEREINRARHGTGRLVLAVTDVDNLKQLNDSQGHAAGDALLRGVVASIQAHLRSYDPIVRVGGDEFVCALGDCTLADARRRFHEIQSTMRQAQPAASISVGFAPLCPDDTLEQLIAAADAALYNVKPTRPPAVSGDNPGDGTQNAPRLSLERTLKAPEVTPR